MRIDFDNSEGDLALQLIDPDNNTVNVNTSNDFEEISLAGKKQGKYFVKISGVNGVTNPSYTLSIDGTQIPEADSLEPGNETPLQAYDLKDLNTGSRYSAMDAWNFGLAIRRQEIKTGKIIGNIYYKGWTPIVDPGYYRPPYIPSYPSYPIYQPRPVRPRYPIYQPPIYQPIYRPIYSPFLTNTQIKQVSSFVDSWLQPGNGGLLFNFLSSRGSEDGTLSSLSIHTPTDQDWFKFELSSDGQKGQNIVIDFDHNQGNLQLEIYEAFNPNNTTQNDYQKYLVERINGNGDTEEISLSGLAKGSYYARVTGVNGSTNPYYNLTLNTPPQVTQTEDFTEPNNSNSSPYDLRTVEGSLAVVGLSIHNTTDQDWFQFTTKGIGKTDHKVRIDFSDSQGDLDLILYN
ncbi:MAG: pre-peptidase C-terminal domain-containing protein, partial [Microcystis panniformis]